MGARGPKPKYTDVSCPNENCEMYGVEGEGNIIANGTYSTEDGIVRKFKCKVCGRVFNSRTGTMMEGLRSSSERVETVINCINEGNGIRATARINHASPSTVIRWSNRLGEHSRKVMELFEVELEVIHVQMDELWCILEKRPKTDGKYFRGEGMWGWTAIDQPTKYMLEAHIGQRDIENAKKFLEELYGKLDSDHIPVFTTDGYHAYAQVLLAMYGHTETPERNGNVGRLPKARVVPDPGLNYAQVVKTRDGPVVTKVEVKQIFGNVPQEMCNTYCVERQNLNIRSQMARFRRKSLTFSKKKENLELAMEGYRTFYNFCRNHMTLQAQARACGIKGKFTPAMALGLTDHVWSVRELVHFSYRKNIN